MKKFFNSRTGGKDGYLKIIVYLILFLLLCCGFSLLFQQAGILRQFTKLVQRTAADLNAASRQRTLEGRKRLLELQEKHSFLFSLERQLQYSGLKLRFPGLTVEWWIAGNAVVAAGLFLIVLLPAGLWPAVGAVAVLAAAEGIALRILRSRNLRRVNGSLMKLLDFLGNYSVTAAEAAGVFGQVSRYMDEPLRSALEACCSEARTTGDVGLALLTMAEKIEHPKFKELARNMEISIRHCADFSALVKSSRRSLREYLRISQERRGMLREALVNMALLLAMSAAVLAAVGSLTGISFGRLLADTVPGKIAVIVLAGIFGMFGSQIYRAQS